MGLRGLVAVPLLGVVGCVIFLGIIPMVFGAVFRRYNRWRRRWNARQTDSFNLFKAKESVYEENGRFYFVDANGNEQDVTDIVFAVSELEILWLTSVDNDAASTSVSSISRISSL